MDKSNICTLKNEVENLLNLNEEIKNQSRKIDELKYMKSETETKINELLKDLNLEHKKFMLHDNLIMQKKSMNYQSLSLKYIEQCLTQCMNEETKMNVMKIIKQNRNVKEKIEIKIENKCNK